MIKIPFRREHDAQSVSGHILPNAATMVGICPTLIGLIKLSEAEGMMRWADECLGVITVLFAISALASYVSIRNGDDRHRGRVLEEVADVFFMVGLVGLAGVSLLFAYQWI